MKRPQSPHDVLFSLAAGGDPSAFYALFSERARKVYLLLRSSGKDRERALTILIAFFRKLYRDFVARPPRDSLDEWYARRRRRLPIDRDSPEETIAAQEYADVASGLQLLFQREYSRRSRAARSRARLAPLSRGQAAVARVLIAVIVLFLVIIASQVYMLSTGARLSVDLTSRTSRMTFSLPPGPDGFFAIVPAEVTVDKREHEASKRAVRPAQALPGAAGSGQ